MIETGRAVHLHQPLRSRNVLTVSSVAGFRLSLLDHFGIDSDIDIVTDDHTAVVQGGIPLYAEVLAIDFRRGACRGWLIAPGIFHMSSRALNVEDDFLGGAANGEVAGNLELSGSELCDSLGFESHGRKVGDVKEFVAAQVVITGGLACVHGRDVNSDVDGGFGDVIVVQHNRADDLAESSPYGGDGHMTNRKLRG